MNKILQIFILFLFVGCSQNKYHFDEITSPSDTLFYLKNDMSLLNGVVYDDFGNNIGSFKNGERDGVFSVFYKSGQLKELSGYKNGQLDGIRKYWYEGGQLEEKQVYKNGKRVGEWFWWYENGQLRGSLNFKNDNENGVTKFWYENGQLNQKRSYMGGELHGIWKEWSETGQLVFVGKYINGKKHGPQVKWNIDGEPEGYINWKHNEKDGEEFFFIDGFPLRQEWKDGSKVGGNFNILKDGWTNRIDSIFDYNQY